MSNRPKRDRIIGHGADNDGIEEYDNPLPDWWIGLTLFTVVFGVFYTIDYHFVSHESEASDYKAEIAAADKMWPKKDLALDPLDPKVVEEGHQIWTQNACATCHGEDMHGKIGPNLTDDQWLHGGTYSEIKTTITTGVPSKGMPTWGPILGPEKVAKVAAWVYSVGPKMGLEPAAGVVPGTPVNVPASGPTPPGTAAPTPTDANPAAPSGTTGGASSPAPADPAAAAPGAAAPTPAPASAGQPG